MRERKSIGMKNFIFKSQDKFDFKKIISVLEIIQKEQRANRYDNILILKKLEICVKGLALLVSTPEPEGQETLDVIEDSREGN